MPQTQNTTPSEPTVADLHRLNKRLNDEKKMLTNQLFEADQKLQSQTAQIERLQNKQPVLKKDYVMNPDGGLPAWFAIVFAVGVGAVAILIFWVVAPELARLILQGGR